MTESSAGSVTVPRAARASSKKAPPARAATGSLPELGTRLVLFYIFIEYARPQYYLPMLNYAKLGVIGASLGGLYLVFAKRNPFPPVAWAIIAFLAIQAKTIPFAPNQKIAFFATETLFFMLVAGPFVIMTALDSTERLRRVIWLYAVLGFIQAVQVLRSNGHGVGGFFWDENDASMLLSTVLPIAFFYGANASTPKRRLAGYCGFAICAIGIMVSLSRGGFLAMTAVGLYIIFRSRRRLAAVSAILVALLLIIPFIPAGYFNEMKTIETADQKGDTGEQRLYMWGVAWKVFLHNPIMGVGTENYPRVGQEFEDPTRGRHLWGFACHSTYFTLFAEGGIPGTIAWVTMIVLAFSATRRAARLAHDELARVGLPPEAAARAQTLFGITRGIEGAMIGFLVAAAFLTVIYYPVLWTLVAFAAVTRVVAEREFRVPVGATEGRS